MKALDDSFIEELCFDFMFCFGIMCIKRILIYFDALSSIISAWRCIWDIWGLGGQLDKPESSVPWQ